MTTVPPVGSESEDQIHREILTSDRYFLIGDGERGPRPPFATPPNLVLSYHPPQLAQYASLRLSFYHTPTNRGPRNVNGMDIFLGGEVAHRIAKMSVPWDGMCLAAASHIQRPTST